MYYLLEIHFLEDSPDPGSLGGKESTCNAGDPASIPGLERSPGKGIGNPLRYSWVSLVAQSVKNPPAMWETWVRSLGWKDPLEKGTATHSNILAWKIPRTEEPGRLQSMGLQRVGHDWVTFTFTRPMYCPLVRVKASVFNWEMLAFQTYPSSVPLENPLVLQCRIRDTHRMEF